MTVPPRPDAQVHFGVFFQGVNHTTIWSDPASGSQIDFETFRRVAQTAERGLFDAFFLGEGLRLREQDGRILELDIAGRPDAITQLAALAGVTRHIGLVTTQNTTYNEPADLARRLSGLDLISGGRAGWNAVTTDNAWTGENFRRGGYLDHALRYERAGEFLAAARAIWDSWRDGAIATSPQSPGWAATDAVHLVERSTDHFRVSITPTLPRSPQGHPVIFQAGDSATGRDFTAAHADVIFSRHGTHFDDALAFANDIRARLRTAGRPEDDIKILPGTQIVLAEKESEVEEKVRWVKDGQYTGQTALSLAGQVWGRDLSHLDPDGPLPKEDPQPRPISETRGAPRHGQDPQSIAREWRARAEAENLSLRAVVIASTERSGFAGTPTQVADKLAHWVRQGAVDGFNISPYLVPGGLDEIVDWLVPELQERGVYRTEYTGTTLRHHLGLRAPLTRRG
ncbi:NtaA/DmoA family FMN-dependent monooxygenase [Nocardia brasiliensis]|uniref:Nitrilotriacetate monooxygenase, component A n=1 Tax=Nocardia brasiliensis (strain ATCC 700358 / HUJEG-1) TaxID=1133849 RepID=K0F2Z7_NOCB7|nr:NtaA/DmoA family FMN-dependent monooxygenase [Nocardia brasiliensis]AFU02001.1 nitrilotriacetate monooxygenase, component A [Nocardia brasiliensis ATCC 700358]OCF87771.1 F420-dependent methylene-tetrahydromethanopterin reductase [Nocardia brasiliensis]